MEYLYILQQALVWALSIYWAYQVVISFCSLIKLKDKYGRKQKKRNKVIALFVVFVLIISSMTALLSIIASML